MCKYSANFINYILNKEMRNFWYSVKFKRQAKPFKSNDFNILHRPIKYSLGGSRCFGADMQDRTYSKHSLVLIQACHLYETASVHMTSSYYYQVLTWPSCIEHCTSTVWIFNLTLSSLHSIKACKFMLKRGLLSLLPLYSPIFLPKR